MANNPQEDDDFRSHLEAEGEREVVYCHECHRQWYRNEYGLGCPGCGGEITEIVSSDFDPRPPPRIQRPPTPPEFRSLQSHNPWGAAGDSDPEEDDIEEHVTHSGNSVIFTRTVRSSHTTRPRWQSRTPSQVDDEPDVMNNFQTLVGNLLGPQFHPGQPGRTVFSQDGNMGHVHGRDNGGRMGGTQFTFTTTGGRAGPRDPDGPQPGGPVVDDLATLLGGIFGQMAPAGAGGPAGNGPPGMPPALQALFGQIFNPAMARAGDAVYTQEALDQIITGLMEQHTSSNAPGPATAEAIAALPKKLLDEKMLGPEGKGECSVCMDDVETGDEVVVLPCSHWFHEACAGIWLKEHNTCPICRKGIGSEETPSAQSGPTRNESRSGRLNGVNRPRDINRSNTNTILDRNRARLQAIRNLGQRSPTDGGSPFHFHIVGDAHRHNSFSNDYPPTPAFLLDDEPETEVSPSASPRQRRPSRGERMPTSTSRRSSHGLSFEIGSHPSHPPRRLSRTHSQPIQNDHPRLSRRSSQVSGSNAPGPISRRPSQQPTSGDTNRASRSNSQSNLEGGNTGGAFGWLRDRFGGGAGRRQG